jgi:hypothetical protein
MAAFTRLGARKASEIVMLTLRTLQWNEALRIEESLDGRARFAGADPWRWATIQRANSSV